MEGRPPVAEEFGRALNSTFTAGVDGRPVELQLVKVEEKAGPRHDNAFSIEFAGPLEPSLEQGIYRLEHPGLGSFDLFLVPVAGDDDGYVYESVFTRLD